MLIENQRTATVKLTKGEVVSLLLLIVCNHGDSDRWMQLHGKIREQLDKQFPPVVLEGGAENG